jgi:CRISPR-associated protein (TIGR02710 family)
MKSCIISLGGTIEPIIFFLKRYNPDFILFFCSKESVENISDIKSNFDSFPDYDKVILEDAQDANLGILSIKDNLKKFRDKLMGEVVVDITGGTKPMAAALLFGTSGKGYKYNYVGGSLRDKQGRVKTDSMSLINFPDPADEFKDREKLLIVKLFNLYRFEAVVNVIENLTLNSREEDLFFGIKHLAKCYSLWDKFEHRMAKNELGQAIKRLENYYRYNRERVIDLEQLKDHKVLLDKFRLRKDEKFNLMHINDLYSNALRRQEESKFDDAVARLYSCIEHIGKYELSALGIDDSNVDLDSVPDKLKERFKKKYLDEVKEVIKLPLFAKFELLDALGNSKGKEFTKKYELFRKIISSRNESILAHGLRPVSKETCEQFINFVGRFINKNEIITFGKLRW